VKFVFVFLICILFAMAKEKSKKPAKKSAKKAAEPMPPPPPPPESSSDDSIAEESDKSEEENNDEVEDLVQDEPSANSTRINPAVPEVPAATRKTKSQKAGLTFPVLNIKRDLKDATGAKVVRDGK
jgi:hypothetical protein